MFGLLLLSGALAHAVDSRVDPKDDAPPIADFSDPWKFNVSLPGWMANTSGTVGVDGVNSHVYLGFDTLIKKLDMVASLSAEARKGRFGFYGDMLYVSASDGIGNDGLIEKVAVRLDEYLIDLEMNYRILQGPHGWLDVRAGVRYTNVYNKLTISPNDEAIDRASTDLVDDVSRLIRNRIEARIEALDIRGRLRGALADRIGEVTGDLDGGLRNGRRALPIAPLGARRPGRIGDLIQTVIDRRAESLAAALRAEVAATTEQLRAAARRRIDAEKSRIAKEIARTLRSELDNSFTVAEQWWDPYIGLRGRYNLSDAFYLTAKADIGGFGVGSDLTWQASGALGCQVSRYVSLEAGYRYLYTDYSHNGFVYDVSQSGVEVTAGISF